PPSLALVRSSLIQASRDLVVNSSIFTMPLGLFPSLTKAILPLQGWAAQSCTGPMVLGTTAPKPAKPACFSLAPSQPGVAEANTRGFLNSTPAKFTLRFAILNTSFEDY